MLEDAANVAASGQRTSLKRAEVLEIAQNIQEECRSSTALIDAARVAVGDDDGIAPDTEHLHWTSVPPEATIGKRNIRQSLNSIPPGRSRLLSVTAPRSP